MPRLMYTREKQWWRSVAKNATINDLYFLKDSHSRPNKAWFSTHCIKTCVFMLNAFPLDDSIERSTYPNLNPKNNFSNMNDWPFVRADRLPFRPEDSKINDFGKHHYTTYAHTDHQKKLKWVCLKTSSTKITLYLYMSTNQITFLPMHCTAGNKILSYCKGSRVNPQPAKHFWHIWSPHNSPRKLNFSQKTTRSIRGHGHWIIFSSSNGGGH